MRLVVALDCLQLSASPGSGPPRWPTPGAAGGATVVLVPDDPRRPDLVRRRVAEPWRATTGCTSTFTSHPGTELGRLVAPAADSSLLRRLTGWLAPDGDR
jgi:hypothetical protein